MPLPGDAAPPAVDWLVREVRTLRRELEELRAARSAEATTVGRGGITIRDDGRLQVIDANGDLVTRIGALGYLYDDGTAQQGAEFHYEDGRIAMGIWNPHAHTPADPQYWAAYDLSGRIVLSTDGVTGDGLARPWLPITFQRSDIAPPTNSGVGVTQSGTFTGVYEAFSHRQHPYLEARCYLAPAADGTTAGEARLMLAGSMVGTVAAAPANTAKVNQFTVRVNAPFGQLMQLTYELRRTAGAGNVYGKVDAWWRQT